jgi:hypothetical protein
MEKEMIEVLKEISETLKEMKNELSEISTAIREVDIIDEEEERSNDIKPSVTPIKTPEFNPIITIDNTRLSWGTLFSESFFSDCEAHPRADKVI